MRQHLADEPDGKDAGQFLLASHKEPRLCVELDSTQQTRPKREASGSNRELVTVRHTHDVDLGNPCCGFPYETTWDLLASLARYADSAWLSS